MQPMAAQQPPFLYVVSPTDVSSTECKLPFQDSAFQLWNSNQKVEKKKIKKKKKKNNYPSFLFSFSF